MHRTAWLDRMKSKGQDDLESAVWSGSSPAAILIGHIRIPPTSKLRALAENAANTSTHYHVQEQVIELHTLMDQYPANLHEHFGHCGLSSQSLACPTLMPLIPHLLCCQCRVLVRTSIVFPYIGLPICEVEVSSDERTDSQRTRCNPHIEHNMWCLGH